MNSHEMRTATLSMLRLTMLDEIDSGLDIDALKDVAKAINDLLRDELTIILITHYQRLLDLVRAER